MVAAVFLRDIHAARFTVKAAGGRGPADRRRRAGSWARGSPRSRTVHLASPLCARHAPTDACEAPRRPPPACGRLAGRATAPFRAVKEEASVARSNTHPAAFKAASGSSLEAGVEMARTWRSKPDIGSTNAFSGESTGALPIRQPSRSSRYLSTIYFTNPGTAGTNAAMLPRTTQVTCALNRAVDLRHRSFGIRRGHVGSVLPSRSIADFFETRRLGPRRPHCRPD